jgi:hypothetical protein
VCACLWSVTRYSEEGACERKQDDAEKDGDRLRRQRCLGGTNLAAAEVSHGVVDERQPGAGRLHTVSAEKHMLFMTSKQPVV